MQIIDCPIGFYTAPNSHIEDYIAVRCMQDTFQYFWDPLKVAEIR